MSGQETPAPCEPVTYMGCSHHPHHSHSHHSHTHNFKPPTAATPGQNGPSSLTPSIGMLPTVCEQDCTCHHHHSHLTNLGPANPHYHRHHGMYHHQHLDSNLAGYTSSNSDNNAPNNHTCHHFGGGGNPTGGANTTPNVNIPSVACDCGSLVQEPSLQSGRSSRLISCDENNPSGSEDSGRKCPSRTVTDLDAPRQRSPQRADNNERKPINCNNENRKYSNRIEIYSDNTDPEDKIDTATADAGPPLPPRPRHPPRQSHALHNSAPHASVGIRKYVIWCLVCGGFSCLLGIMFLGVYFLLRSYTSTVSYFETVPTFVPATLLMLTGICIMSLARRRNRYSYLIKLSGACGLASALTCALVTVTTTVLHMSRLQALRECEYTQKTRTCTCYSVMIESQIEGVEEGVRFVFDSTADCGVVHGALYSCLRAVFGLSVAGVLVAVFSCMLVYQLLSHERKKMYWEQLELRCRSLYSGQQGPPIPPSGPSIIGTPRGGPCRCCEQCHAHRAAMPSAYPWDGDNRFWVPGQAGNFYSPNPGGDEINGQVRINSNGQRNRTTGWNWPRMPWQRNEPTPNNRFRQTPSSPDSQYGFSNGPQGQQDPSNVSTAQGGYSVIGPGYGVWGPMGPPPPYSDPNSPARRGRYQYIHPGQCPQMLDSNLAQMQTNIAVLECHSSGDSHTMDPFCPQQQQQQQQQQHHRNLSKRQTGFKTKDNYENTPSDSDGGPRDRFSNTLPIRKTKKRVEAGAKSIGPNNQTANRVNIQNVFQGSSGQHSEQSENEYNEPSLPGAGTASTEPSCSNLTPGHLKQRKVKIGVENSGFQAIEPPDGTSEPLEPAESEVYFADVSSCCNVSVKNDNYYEDANQRRVKIEKDNKEDVDDYLSQRFGKREASVRSRLPFPQMIPEDYEKPQMNIPVVAPRPSLMRKDISRQSMMSVDSGEKTDFTDLSPATPGTNFIPSYPIDFAEPNSSSFVASSYPYSSNEQSQEAHRRSTKNLPDVFLAPDAQYEVIKDTPRDFETTPLTMSGSYDAEVTPAPYNIKSHFHSTAPGSGVAIQSLVSINCTNSNSSSSNNPKSPKNLNITPIKRQNLGTNISAIIQNLGGSDVSLLYPDNRLDNDESDTDDTMTTKNNQTKDCSMISSDSSSNNSISLTNSKTSSGNTSHSKNINNKSNLTDHWTTGDQNDRRL